MFTSLVLVNSTNLRKELAESDLFSIWYNSYAFFFYSYHSKEAKICGVSQQKSS